MQRLPSDDYAYPPVPGGPREQARQRGLLRGVKRSITLTRPERGVAPPPLIQPTTTTGFSDAPPIPKGRGSIFISTGTPLFDANKKSWWKTWSSIFTFWAPSFLLTHVGRMRTPLKRQAWREKIMVVMAALMMGCVTAFFTVGVNRVMCPDGHAGGKTTLLGQTAMTLGIRGDEYNISSSATQPSVDFYALALQLPGQDITPLFQPSSEPPSCAGHTGAYATSSLCGNTSIPRFCVLPQLTSTSIGNLAIDRTGTKIAYSWRQIKALPEYIVLNGLVINLGPYLAANPSPLPFDSVDSVLRHVLSSSTNGKDATRLLSNTPATSSAIQCLSERYLAGRIDNVPPACFFASILMYVVLAIVMGIIAIRFGMALVFSWFLAPRMSRSDSTPGVTLTAGRTAPTDIFTVCLVTCYSEGYTEIRATLDSITDTTYSDSRKLLFVVCDGLVRGHGETRTTAEICTGLLTKDPRFGEAKPMGYIAVGSGPKRENAAFVHAGHYISSRTQRKIPMLVVVKCGSDTERLAGEGKPGNRGKRDSQMILMNFIMRVNYNERFTPVDFDLFRKVYTLCGVHADYFEAVLMVDADTRIAPDSLTTLVNCLHNDPSIMGICGETQIANKRASWISAIQVFEYYISHHLSKAFESVFGGVTCLPGCFSMYRLKARRGDGGKDWVPILAQPSVCQTYSQSDVSTLHEKSLLELGEDRFLSTLMIRTFPRRKMVFCPAAKCKTVVPDTFAVLLSQRRRWIGSSIHNLFELAQVPNLCGVFCFSYQFLVIVELFGTLTLPIGIILTYALAIDLILEPPTTFQQCIPVILLVSVLALPTLLVVATARKPSYVVWMLIYIAALPIWNFVMPIYALWHLDDLSWGDTRRVEGETAKQKVYSEDKTAVFDGTSVPLRRWADWEKSRLRNLRRSAQRKRYKERMDQVKRGRQKTWQRAEAETVVSDDSGDKWCSDIGGYDEYAPQYPPPPIVLPAILGTLPGAVHQTLDGNAMEDMLSRGF